MDYQATQKLNLNGGVTYNFAESSWDWNFAQRPTLEWTGLALDVDGAAPNTAYDTWDQNNQMDEYSDLSYEQYSFTFGATYDFTSAFYSKIQGTYDIFESEEEYVYGDEDGKAFSGYVAVGYKF